MTGSNGTPRRTRPSALPGWASMILALVMAAALVALMVALVVWAWKAAL